jgi:hypothetical protein
MTSASHIFAPGHDAPAVSHLGALDGSLALWARGMGHVVRVSDSNAAFTLVNFSPAAGWFGRERRHWRSSVSSNVETLWF